MKGHLKALLSRYGNDRVEDVITPKQVLQNVQQHAYHQILFWLLLPSSLTFPGLRQETKVRGKPT